MNLHPDPQFNLNPPRKRQALTRQAKGGYHPSGMRAKHHVGGVKKEQASDRSPDA